jgi:hypothetical protein
MARTEGSDPRALKPNGPVINSSGFRALVVHYLGRMDAGQELSAADYYTMIRLWNTIESERLGGRDPLFKRYASTFFPTHVERAAQCLGAYPTKGMALYSKEYDVYLGSVSHAPSRYRIVDGS